MSESRKIFSLPTQEIYLPNSDIEVAAGKLAVIGFIDQEFVLPEGYREDGAESRAWPALLLEVADRPVFSNVEDYEAYRLTPNYVNTDRAHKNDPRWLLHQGWDTLVQYKENGLPQLWSGGEDAYLFDSPRAYDQRKTQLAVHLAMGKDMSIAPHSRFVTHPGELRRKQ